METYLEQPAWMPSISSISIPEINSSSQPEDQFFDWLDDFDPLAFQGYAQPEIKNDCTEQSRPTSPSPLIEFMESLSSTKPSTFSGLKSSANLETFSQPNMSASSSLMEETLSENSQSLDDCEPSMLKGVTEPEVMDTGSVQSGSILPSQLITFTESNSSGSASSLSNIPANSCTTEKSLTENRQSLGVPQSEVMNTRAEQRGSTPAKLGISSQPISSVKLRIVSQMNSSGNSSTTRSLSGNNPHLGDYEPAILKGAAQSEARNTHAQQTRTTPSSRCITLIKATPNTEPNLSASASSQPKSSAIVGTFSKSNMSKNFNTTEESLSGNNQPLGACKPVLLKGIQLKNMNSYIKQAGSTPKSSTLQVVQVPKSFMKPSSFTKPGPCLLSLRKPPILKSSSSFQPNSSLNSMTRGESSAEFSQCLSSYKPTALEGVVKTEVMTAHTERHGLTSSPTISFLKPKVLSKQSVSSRPVSSPMPGTDSLPHSSFVSSRPVSAAMPSDHSLPCSSSVSSQPVSAAVPSTHSLPCSSSASSQPVFSAMPSTHPLPSSSRNPNTTAESLTDYSALLENYKPGIPDNVVSNLMQTAGLSTTNPMIVRVISAASEKFISDLVNDAVQHSKMRPSTSDNKRLVLKMDDLIQAAEEFGIKVKKPRYFGP